MPEITNETEHYYEEQFLEKPRKGVWSDIIQHPVDSTGSKELSQILVNLNEAHQSHGKPLRLVKIKRTVVTELEVIEVFQKPNTRKKNDT